MERRIPGTSGSNDMVNPPMVQLIKCSGNSMATPAMRKSRKLNRLPTRIVLRTGAVGQQPMNRARAGMPIPSQQKKFAAESRRGIRGNGCGAAMGREWVKESRLLPANSMGTGGTSQPRTVPKAESKGGGRRGAALEEVRSEGVRVRPPGYHRLGQAVLQLGPRRAKTSASRSPLLDPSLIRCLFGARACDRLRPLGWPPRRSLTLWQCPFTTVNSGVGFL